ncbi:MAG: hypothetical protein U0Y82_06850 [Thermoleophilia bacterium]
MVAALGEREWSTALRDLTGPVAADATPPTYGALAGTGVDLVTGLARDGRWEAAHLQAAHLADYFTRHRRRVHPVAAVALQGLCDAARAHDDEDLTEHADLLRELFPPGDAPPGG